MGMSSLPQKIHKLEQDIIQFKASQALGASSSQVIPVYHLDITVTALWYLGLGVVFKFTSGSVINPLVMPRLKAYIDGVEYTDVDLLQGIDYDEYLVALDAAEWTGETYALPDEHSTGFRIFIVDNNEKGLSDTSVFRIVGTVYATCQGDCKVYTTENYY